MDIKVVLGSIPPAMDPLDRNRHVFRKGRMEFMGGRTCYEQGHGIDGFENQNRRPGYGYYGRDPIAQDLGVDTEEY